MSVEDTNVHEAVKKPESELRHLVTNEKPRAVLLPNCMLGEPLNIENMSVEDTQKIVHEAVKKPESELRHLVTNEKPRAVLLPNCMLGEVDNLQDHHSTAAFTLGTSSNQTSVFHAPSLPAAPNMKIAEVTTALYKRAVTDKSIAPRESLSDMCPTFSEAEVDMNMDNQFLNMSGNIGEGSMDEFNSNINRPTINISPPDQDSISFGVNSNTSTRTSSSTDEVKFQLELDNDNTLSQIGRNQVFDNFESQGYSTREMDLFSADVYNGHFSNQGFFIAESILHSQKFTSGPSNKFGFRKSYRACTDMFAQTNLAYTMDLKMSASEKRNTPTHGCAEDNGTVFLQQKRILELEQTLKEERARSRAKEFEGERSHMKLQEEIQTFKAILRERESTIHTLTYFEEKANEKVQNLQAEVQVLRGMLKERTLDSQPSTNSRMEQRPLMTSTGYSTLHNKRNVRHVQPIQKEQSQDDKHNTGHKLRKSYDDTLRELFVDQYANITKSVGCLVSQRGKGTLFRVGSKYGMTAAHVVTDIINPHKHEQGDATRLCRDNVYVYFSESGVDITCKFRLSGRIEFWDNILDVAIVEFCEERIAMLPPSLSLLSHDIFSSQNDVAVVGFGHNTNDFKCVEHSVKVVDPESVPVTDIKNYLEQRQHIIKPVLKRLGKDFKSVDEGYTGYKDQHHVLLNAYVGPGASGSPIFTKADPAALQVVGIYTCGYPRLSYELPSTINFPLQWTFEAGTKMKFIYEALKSQNEALAADIFSQ